MTALVQCWDCRPAFPRRSVSGETQARIANWIQFAIVLLALLGLALHAEGRLSRVEQQLADAETNRQLMQKQLDRIEGDLQAWRYSRR